MPDKYIAAETANWIKTWWLSWFGGMCFYLYQVHKWEQFKIVWFIINIILAFFVGFVIWEFIPLALEEFRSWIISVSWFITYPLLWIIENKLPTLFESYLDNKIKEWKK